MDSGLSCSAFKFGWKRDVAKILHRFYPDLRGNLTFESIDYRNFQSSKTPVRIFFLNFIESVEKIGDFQNDNHSKT